MGAKLIVCIFLGILSGLAASLVITPIFCVLRFIFYVPFIHGRLREKAKKEGHVVEAHLEKKHTIMPDDKGSITTMKETGTYVYYVNGRKYKCRLMDDAIPGLSDTINLFYIKNPRKATTGGSIGNREWPWFKFYLIISLIAAIVAAVLIIRYFF